MIKNWLIRGDTHGQFNWMLNGCLEKYKPEETAIIILGDAGFNYFLNSRDDKLKAEVDARGFTFYCVRGNHEARPQDVSCGYERIYDTNVHGFVYWQEQYPHINFFDDFGEYWIGPYHIAVIGGAYSVDKWWRLTRNGVTKKLDVNYLNPKKTGWFPNEQLSAEEMKWAEAQLSDKSYDFVFTHTCPIGWQPTDLFLSIIDQTTVDNTMELWLEELKSKFNWYIWLFGHYHADRIERPRVEQYFNDIESLDEICERWQNYDKTGELPWWLNKSPYFYMN